MLEKRRLAWIGSIGVMMWVVTWLVGLWVSPAGVRAYWRVGSEIVWLGLGITYVLLWGERVINLRWRLLLVDVLVFMFGVLVVWILGLVGISAIFNQIDTLGSLREVAWSSGVLDSDSLISQSLSILSEALRLWVVGMVPVAVRRLIGRWG